MRELRRGRADELRARLRARGDGGHRHGARRLRRRGAAGAVRDGRRAARRWPPATGRGHGDDGPAHGRLRPGLRRAAGRRGRADRLPGRRDRHGPGMGRPSRHDLLRDPLPHRAAPAPPARPWRRERPSGAQSDTRSPATQPSGHSARPGSPTRSRTSTRDGAGARHRRTSPSSSARRRRRTACSCCATVASPT